MRKLGHVAAPPAVVAGMFSNLRRWTAWMPGVEAVSLLEESPDSAVAMIQQRWMGRHLTNKFGFSFGADRLIQRQLRGPMRRFETRWHFVEPPDGRGTTVVVDIDFDLGIAGWITPRRVVQDQLDRMFEEVMDNARARARAILAKETLSPAQMQTTEAIALIRLSQTDRGLEIEVEGRSYFLPRRRDR